MTIKSDLILHQIAKGEFNTVSEAAALFVECVQSMGRHQRAKPYTDESLAAYMEARR